MAEQINRVRGKIHRKQSRLHMILEAVGNVFVAYETGHILITIFFVTWAALDAHEIFWGVLDK